MKKNISVVLVMIMIFTSCNNNEGKKLNRYQTSFFSLFDTVTFVLGYAENEADFTKIASGLEAELKIYHELYDIYNNYSNINNIKTINDNAGIAPVKVDKKIIDLLEFGQTAYDRTDGLTNMAMGSVLKIWHNYREEALENPLAGKVPTKEELGKAALHMNIEHVIIDLENSTVFLTDPEMSLDVGSLGKGYAVEMVCQLLEKKGVDHFLLSVGGNVKAVGKKPDGSFWDVGLENPYGGEEYQGIVKIDNSALVTSGNYQRYYEVGGTRYHHIINPKTLMPEHYMSSVAVLCDDSGLADALSTAVFNMSPEEGLAWVEQQPEIEAVWMLPNETKIYSSGFERHLK